MYFLQPRLPLEILFQNVSSIFDARVYAMHLWEIYMYGVTYLWEICMYRSYVSRRNIENISSKYLLGETKGDGKKMSILGIAWS